jgi:hypothetical protein
VGALWDQVRSLAGETLETVDGAKFDVVTVDDKKITIRLHSSDRTYPVYRRELAKAEELGMITADVRPRQLRASHVSEGKPAYVASIIHEVIRRSTSS